MAAPHVAAGKDLGRAGLIAERIGLDIAARHRRDLLVGHYVERRHHAVEMIAVDGDLAAQPEQYHPQREIFAQEEIGIAREPRELPGHALPLELMAGAALVAEKFGAIDRPSRLRRRCRALRRWIGPEIGTEIIEDLLGSYVANKHKEKFLARWTGPLSSVDSMMVQFTNDYKDDKHDVNLLVKDIIIDKKIVLPYMYNSEFDMSKLDGKRRMINNYSSLAELARNRLLAKGIDSSLVIAVPGRHAFVNRTLKSALAFDRWLDTTRCEIKGINVLSLGTHARRTWIIYSKLIDNRYPVGIISVDDFNFNHSVLRRFVKTVRETLGIIYYWFVLIPYAQN